MARKTIDLAQEKIAEIIYATRMQVYRELLSSLPQTGQVITIPAEIARGWREIINVPFSDVGNKDVYLAAAEQFDGPETNA